MFRSLNPVAALARRTACAVQAWRREAIAQRDLKALDERALRDLGLSHRAAAQRRGREPVCR